jgi:hypothetical protein
MNTFKDSSTYVLLNSVNNISEIVKRALTEYETASVESIQKQLIDLRTSPIKLTQSALKAFSEGRIILMYAKLEKVIPASLPFISITKGSDNVTLAFLDNIAPVVNGQFRGNTESLESLISSAYVSLLIRDTGYSVIQRIDIITVVMEIYDNIISNILNTSLGVKSDKVLFDVVTYAIRKFFLYNMMAIDDKDANEKLSIDGLNYMEDSVYSRIATSYDNAGIKDLNQLLEWLKKINARLAQLNPRVFYDRFIRAYQQTSYFAMDNIEYLLYTIIGSLDGSNAVSPAIKTIVKNVKGVSKLSVALNSIS